MSRWALPLMLAVAAGVCAWRGLTHAATTSGGPAVAVPPTPAVSVRRLPIVLGDLVADERLAQRLDADLADPTLAADRVCLEVAVGGAAIYARDADSALIPASNLKLLTADVALRKLGPSSRLSTDAVARRGPSAGVVDGPLWLVGGGDPLLATPGFRATQTDWTVSAEPITALDDLAGRIKEAGVTRVTGGVVGDASRYDHQRALPSWKSSYLATGEIGPVSALVVDSGLDTGGHRKVAVADAALAAARALTTLLQARGVAVDGPASTGTAPPGAQRLASVASLPVADIVGVMLRESDNLAAEMLTKELGVRFGGEGSWSAGLRVIHDDLVGRVPLDGVVQVDGSGLDRTDRLSCHSLVALMASSDPAGQTLAGSLPTAGDCGTLVKRFTRPPTAGRVRAKTGSLAGVAALTGYLAASAPTAPPPCPPGASPGDRVETFSLLVNGVPSDAAGNRVEDRLATSLASYPEIPVLDLFGPQ